jgi:hypothetical protein
MTKNHMPNEAGTDTPKNELPWGTYIAITAAFIIVEIALVALFLEVTL